MDDFNNILDQLKDSSGELKHNLHIFQEIVPVEEQMKYFEYSKNMRKDNKHVDRNRLVAFLFSAGIDVEEKRYCMVMLAGLTDIAAYRAIETYHSSPLEPELKNWSALALMESRILIDSDLSGEQQYLVSTGLGGLNDKLRFFSVLATKDRLEFTDLQQEIIEREFKYAFDKNDIIVEEFSIKENYLKMQVLSNIKIGLKEIINETINECNELGDFIDSKFILTNLKQLDDSEIEKLLKN